MEDNNSNMASLNEVKVCPKEEGQMEVYPLSGASVAGPSGVDYLKDHSEMVEVKPDVKDELIESLMDQGGKDNSDQDDDIENNDDEDESDAEMKKETETEESDSSLSSDESTEDDKKNFKNEADTDTDDDDSDFQLDRENNLNDYEKISSRKNYRKTTIKEECVDNFKDLFKKSPLKIEKEKIHREIFEELVDKNGKISVKELQAQYLAKLREISKVEIFTCELCNYKTMSIKNLKCHLLVIHSTKLENDLFKCNKCDYETSYESYMKRHMPTHKVSKQKYKSSNKKTKTEKKTKRAKEKFPCTECSYKGRSEDGLKRHMVSHKDKSKCDLCSFESEDQSTLKEHKETHRSGKRYLCYKCPYQNNNKLRVGIHLLNEHKIANEVSKRSKICEICSHTFCNINQLRKHYITHKDISELGENEIYKCTECSHQTKYKTNFQLHLRTHKPPEFICDICGFATKHKVSYQYHLITHKKLDEIEWLRCEICPYQARNKKLLYKHMRTGDHSGKKLLHVRNRDRLREAEEKGIPIEDVIRKYKIKRIGGIKIRRERLVKPSKHPKKIRKSKKKPRPENAVPVQEENVIQLSRIHEILPQILY